jgi:hypothetical protein
LVQVRRLPRRRGYQADVQPGQRRRCGLAADPDRDRVSTQLRLNAAILLPRII